MKTLTCSQLGGPCDAPISGNSKDDLLTHAMEHLEAVHPEMAADVKESMANPNDPKMVAWNEDFNKKYDAQPEM